LLFCDNKSWIAVANSSLPTKKSRHYNIRLSRLRELSSSIQFVPTDYNKADPFTKALEAKKYRLLWWTDPYDPKIKINTITGHNIKTYERSNMKSKEHQWKEVEYIHDNAEFSNHVRSFYSLYNYGENYMNRDKSNTTYINSITKHVRFYKL
jgi:hypothetical protein